MMMIFSKKFFVYVFPSNEINLFIDLHKIMISKGSIYSYLTSDADQSDKPGTHWCSILDLHPKNASFFLVRLFWCRHTKKLFS